MVAHGSHISKSTIARYGRMAVAGYCFCGSGAVERADDAQGVLAGDVGIDQS
jgi:hypothetical protein